MLKILIKTEFYILIKIIIAKYVLRIVYYVFVQNFTNFFYDFPI